MKKAMLFLFALVVAMGTNVQAQSLKKLYPADAEVVITPLPFAWRSVRLTWTRWWILLGRRGRGCRCFLTVI